MNIEELQKHLATPITGIYPSKEMAPSISLADGESVSVQARESAYCTPRNNEGPYTCAEVGFPSVAPTGRLLQYIEDPDDPTETVYGYVPLEIILEFINEHGGVK